MDQFTINHLVAYCDEKVGYGDHREAFMTYAVQEILDDPQLIEYGWGSLYHSWLRNTIS